MTVSISLLCVDRMQKRKHLHFSLASLFALTAMSSVVFGLLHFKEQQSNLRRAINRENSYDRAVKEFGDLTGPPFVKVIAADTGEPVRGVVVGMTLIGPDGGDGGFQIYVTAEDGIAPRHHAVTPGRYQYHLDPDPKSRFSPTEWRSGQPYVHVAMDGTTTVPSLKLEIGDRK